MRECSRRKSKLSWGTGHTRRRSGRQPLGSVNPAFASGDPSEVPPPRVFTEGTDGPASSPLSHAALGVLNSNHPRPWEARVAEVGPRGCWDARQRLANRAALFRKPGERSPHPHPHPVPGKLEKNEPGQGHRAWRGGRPLYLSRACLLGKPPDGFVERADNRVQGFPVFCTYIASFLLGKSAPLFLLSAATSFRGG